jgi:UDP-N-acetyl-D-glucosamine dehydrogenase
VTRKFQGRRRGPASGRAACAIYTPIVSKVVPVSSTRAAEMAKLLENIFRCVNIALVNELKMLSLRMGVDIWEVIDAAATKPFGFMPFYPGPGLGGHCIPVDPYYLSWKAREFDFATRFIELAGEVNTAMPYHVVEAVASALNERRKSIKGSKILILGVAYKKDVDDLRESPTLLMQLLQLRGAEARLQRLLPPAPQNASLQLRKHEVGAPESANPCQLRRRNHRHRPLQL